MKIWVNRSALVPGRAAEPLLISGRRMVQPISFCDHGGAPLSYVHSSDDAYRLKAVTGSGLAYAYDYDAADNLISSNEVNGSTHSFPPSTTRNKLTVSYIPGASGTASDYTYYTYNDNGNLAEVWKYYEGKKTRYTWDGINRLIQIEVGLNASANPINGSKKSVFSYDGLSRRYKAIESTHNGSTWATTRTDYWLWAGDQIVQKRVGGVGQIEVKNNYYGIRTKQTGSGSLDTDFGFTGHLFHAESGLWLTKYRAYDAKLGRWLSEDPIGEGGGLNFFGYLSGDVINGSDPLGLFESTTNDKGQISITTEKCEVVVIIGHGSGRSPHKFTFPKGGCSAGAFVGCDAGTINGNIPEVNQIEGAPTWEGDIESNTPDYIAGYNSAVNGAKAAAKKICESKCGCKVVHIRYKKAHKPDDNILDRLLSVGTPDDDEMKCSKK